MAIASSARCSFGLRLCRTHSTGLKSPSSWCTATSAGAGSRACSWRRSSGSLAARVAHSWCSTRSAAARQTSIDSSDGPRWVRCRTTPQCRTARTALGLAGFVPLAVTLSGVVTNEGGSPIAHAFVRVDQDRELAATYTDETGSYRMAFTIRTADPADVSFGANGYEASLRELHVASTEPKYAAQLHRLVRIDSGATTHLVV